MNNNQQNDNFFCLHDPCILTWPINQRTDLNFRKVKPRSNLSRKGVPCCSTAIWSRKSDLPNYYRLESGRKTVSSRTRPCWSHSTISISKPINIRRTSAMSTLIPFSLFLKVGGNNESIAKWILSPAAEFPSTVIVNMFAVESATILASRNTWTCFHVVWDPVTPTACLASIVPPLFCNPTFRVPLNRESVWNR
jgi:hypothetical protein